MHTYWTSYKEKTMKNDGRINAVSLNEVNQYMAKKWTEDDDIYLEYFVFEGDTLVEEAADF